LESYGLGERAQYCSAKMDCYIGFDSAWTDSAKAPGAICAVDIEHGKAVRFHPPQLVSFEQAQTFVQRRRSCSGNTLVALDQPTIVPNLTGMRPVERLAASLVGWLGGGVQPSYRGRTTMFGDAAPIWRFLANLSAVERPEEARVATAGLYVIEVFPALALASLDVGFFGRLAAPKYNPQRKSFRIGDWARVADAVARESRTFGCDELTNWSSNAGQIRRPHKADQDMMDAALCMLTSLRWRLRPRLESLFLGDTTNGYMILPVVPTVRHHLVAQSRRFSVPIDGVTWDKTA